MLYEVTRNRDGKVCAYYALDGLSPQEFVELLTDRFGAADWINIDKVYCEYWRQTKGGSIRKCHQDEPEARPVTAIDLLKWKR